MCVCVCVCVVCETKASCHVNECGAHSPGMTYCSLAVMETQEDNNHQN